MKKKSLWTLKFLLEADLESYSTVNLDHFLFIEKEDISDGEAKSQEGTAKSHGEEIICKMAAKIPIPLLLLLGNASHTPLGLVT